MPSVFYAVRPMNTDRSDNAGSAAPERARGNHRCASAYMAVSITCIHRESRRVAEETAARGIKAEERTTFALGFIERSSGYCGSARIRHPITIYVINRRFVSAVPDVRINPRNAFSRDRRENLSRRSWDLWVNGKQGSRREDCGMRIKKGVK